MVFFLKKFFLRNVFGIIRRCRLFMKSSVDLPCNTSTSCFFSLEIFRLYLSILHNYPQSCVHIRSHTY